MRLKLVTGLLVLLAVRTAVTGQSPETGWEDRPKVTAVIELLQRTRIETWGELQHGLNFSFQRWRGGAILDRRMKPILKAHRADIDENNEHYLVLGAGYEYLHTVQNGSKTIENRIIAQATPRVLFAGVLLSDRNRSEFRWVNGAYNFRYRNKLVISGRLQMGTFRFTPYGSGVIYYDRNDQSWNQSQYGFGVQFPYKKHLMLDTYLLHQNCTGCSQNPVNMIGAALNLYFRQPQ